nr:mitochondrial import inner membrane translocase subunit TIM10 [Cryptococcus depauperatus CBS 7855]
MAVAELDMITDVFNRLVTSCHTKCISSTPLNYRYAEGDLLKGESVCIDRCTAKFFEVRLVSSFFEEMVYARVNKKVGERMSAMGNTAQATGSFGR